MIEVNVNKVWFEYIKKGYKKIDGRLNKGKFIKLKKGDKIKFVNKDESFDVDIIDIRYYPNFRQYLIMEGLLNTLPNIFSIDEGIILYRQIYTIKDEKYYGVLSIEFKLINDTHNDTQND